MKLQPNKRVFLYGSIIGIVLLLLLLFMPSDILMNPAMTPVEYLASKPSITLFSKWVVIVPSSSVIVYLLGVEIILIGYLLYRHNKQLWSYSLIFWGVGTILAGTSYQGLGYELKCAGNTLCQFTSWFELSYLFVTAISISLMALAFAQECTKGTTNTYLRLYGKIALVAYTIILVSGAIGSIQFFISYELFTIFFMPLFVVFFVINIIRFRQTHQELDRQFIILWILFLVVNLGYYVYYIPGFTESLYTQTGIWFSANDVLHVGLILWFYYFWRKVIPTLSTIDEVI